jgi:GR25 family glycosyltransferase involved in LPS biosynthesis
MNNIEKIYCVNLPKDLERKQYMSLQFSTMNIEDKIIWFYANKPRDGYKSNNYNYLGEFGCTLSHLKIYVDSLKFPGHILILEDDATFFNITESNERIDQVMSNLPKEWDIIYLGGAPRENLKRYDDNISIVGDFRQTVGYIINHQSKIKLANFIIDNLSNPYPWATADGLLIQFLKNENKGFCFYPPLVYQKEGHSPLRNEYRDYRKETDNFWKENKPE